MTLIHGTSVAFADGDQWSAVVLQGPSGVGKSDLALRLIDNGARLVADDQVALAALDGRVTASAPKRLSGLLEVRGLGIVERPYLETANVVLVCELCVPEDIARMPEAETVRLAGVAVSLLRLAPFENSAPAKLRLGVDLARRGILARNL
ncbi:MAG: serine/threonine protein kinase [Alphaproteobacteria bacterium]|nr:serine/threonine protein kinase [Alphaproteobacteria bacterium]